MAMIKPLSEQTLMNNYVFSMVMRVPKRIGPLLEYILGKKIRRISMVEPEKTMKEKFEVKGIRLNLYVEEAPSNRNGKAQVLPYEMPCAFSLP